ncbi:MAG: PD-(D/E)XK nuclease family protein [Bryobacteraceae bacterium]
MRLLTGPAGSGKSFHVLQEFRAALKGRDAGVRLLTPTATMAQHLQNLLAREGFVFHPGLIQTLSRFVDTFVSDVPQVSEPLLYLIVEEAARRVDRLEFARVVPLPGFCAALARTMEEFSSAGCDADRLGETMTRRGIEAPLSAAFVAVYREVDRELARRGLATRSRRLLKAAERISTGGLADIRTVWLDGFHALPDPELAVIEAMCRHTEVTLTLPQAPLTESTRSRLLDMGFQEEVSTWTSEKPRLELCEAPSIEREADEIARRILEQAASGRAFRDIGIVVRNQEVYEGILRSTLSRFGIPARFYFDAELLRHALARYLAGAVDAMISGWDFAPTLEVLRVALEGASDEFDHAVRRQFPGRGLAGLERIAEEVGSPSPQVLDAMRTLETWRGIALSPAEWAERLKLWQAAAVSGCPDPANSGDTEIWRGRGAVLEAFGTAMDEAAQALGDRSLALSEFWRAAKSVLRLTPLRLEDRRRNVVHVIGAHEARQWRLPVMFLCGLVEKQFPKAHAHEPFFPDSARSQLKQAGIRVRAAADFEEEERFLFDWAITRATETLALSYPRFDARGQQNLRSLFLDGVDAEPTHSEAVRPAARQQTFPATPATQIAAPDLLDALAAKHRTLRPSALESYLQCPFQFFGQRTLRLEKAPARPEERMDFLLQGTIVHAVLAELPDPAHLEQVFDRIFGRFCDEQRVPAGYRTQASRERMLADLRNLYSDGLGPREAQTRVEADFRYAIGDGLEIKGRIDRLEATPDGNGWIIDYKYSSPQNVRGKVKGELFLQPQLYTLAAERAFGLRVAGMLYCGLRGGVTWAGWSEEPRNGAIDFPPQWREQAIETTMRAAGEIWRGKVEPSPADAEKCIHCDYRDACRFQVGEPEMAEGAGTWD